MLTTIAIIAALVCALTAVTTSFRALGKSKEQSGYVSKDFRRARKLYIVVTGVWLILSGLFLAPVLVREWVIGNYTLIALLSLFFLGVFIAIVYIWKKTYAETEE